MFSKRKISVVCLAVSLALFAAGCKKKVPAPPPPPPPPPPTDTRPSVTPAAPAVAQFTAEPSSIQAGQSATLRWEVSGQATSVSINQGIGTVRSTGSQSVTPSSSTTYTLTASGPGGSITASATVAVVTPPPAAAPPPTTTRTTTARGTVESRLGSDVQDAFFDYDKSDINGDGRDALTRDAAALKAVLSEFPNAVIMIEGHCDERGSAEYNLGLGDRRASSAKEFLVQLGVPADRIKPISYGKERPQCTDATEACYQKNRRVHFAPGQ
jgi:peptidoglycan-associated lipoprotein